MVRPSPEDLARAISRNEAAIRAWPVHARPLGAGAEALPGSGWSTAIVVAVPSASDDALVRLTRAATDAGGQLGPDSRLVIVEGARVMDPQAGHVSLEGRAEIGTGVSTALEYLTSEALSGAQRRGFRILVVADEPASSTFEEMELRSTVAHILETTPIGLSTIAVGRHHLDALDLPGLADYRTADAATLPSVLVSEITKHDIDQ
jgi:hypothetical protein